MVTGVTLPYDIDRASGAEWDRIAASGAAWVRVDAAWTDVERTPGNYTYDRDQRIYDAANARGIKVLWVMGYNDPAVTGAVGEKVGPAGTAVGQFSRFCVDFVGRFGTKNCEYEIWNEPDHVKFWSPEPSPDDYTVCLATVSKAVKAAYPSAFLVFGGVAHTGPKPSDLGWLKRCCAEGALDYVDAVGIHPYQGGPPEYDNRLVENVRAVLSGFPGGAKKPLYATETGYSESWVQPSFETQDWTPNAPNLLATSGDLAASSWTGYYQTPPSVVVPGPAQTGDAVARRYTPDAGDTTARGIVQKGDLNPNAYYDVSVWLRADQARFVFVGIDDAHGQAIRVTPTWTRYVFTVKTGDRPPGGRLFQAYGTDFGAPQTSTLDAAGGPSWEIAGPMVKPSVADDASYALARKAVIGGYIGRVMASLNRAGVAETILYSWRDENGLTFGLNDAMGAAKPGIELKGVLRPPPGGR